VTRHPRIVVRALTWNLYHGRSVPSGLGRSEFVNVLRSLDWDVALLQEAPPRWRGKLAAGLGGESAITLTSRNRGAPVRAWIADRWPDLIKSNEGGSNQLLVRPPWRLAETREHTLTKHPERRRMLWARLEGPGGAAIAAANVHGSVDTVEGASEQILEAAALAVEWAGELPLVFGGDLNLRVTRQPELFDELRARFGLTRPTARDAIDHLLVRGLEIVEPPQRAAASAREFVSEDGRTLRLSDHAYVTASFGMP
jgi:endonuclease/exonuclease/phosphatase family metal-dependent hydrolase